MLKMLHRLQMQMVEHFCVEKRALKKF